MPRRHGNEFSPDSAVAARRRFAARLSADPTSEPLLELVVAEDEAGERGAAEHGAAGSTGGDAGAGYPDGDVRATRFRWRTPWRAAVLVAVIAALVVGWNLWQSAVGSSTSEPLGSAGPVDEQPGTAGAGQSPGTPQPPASASGAEGNGSVVVVHVAGAVHKPGVVSLPQGSRVFQAIEAAGGAAADAAPDGLNLAEVLSDGVRVYVPTVGEPAATSVVPSSSQAGAGGAVGTTASGTSAGAKININTASAEELGTLPRVGPVMAQRIVDWRKEHGSFASVDELDAIDGIGPKLMESLQKLVTVNGG